MGNRIVGFDVARAFAFMGMVLVNYSLVMAGSDTGSRWLASAIGLLQGRAAATFVVLAGVGVSLMSRQAREDGDRIGLARHRTVLFRRAAFLFFTGLLYTPLWPADILHFYGLYIVLGAFLLGATDRRLWQVATVLTVGFVLLNFILDYEAGWNWNTLAYVGFWTPTGLVRHMLFNGFHPVLPWAAFLLAGMWLGRQDFHQGEFRRRLLLWSLSTVVVAESISRLLIRELSATADSGTVELVSALFGSAPMPPFPLYVIAGIGTAFTIIVMCVHVTLPAETNRWYSPLVYTGQLALTLYVAHVVIGMGTLDALDRLYDQTLVFATTASVVFCALSVLFAYFWRRQFKRGPVEWVMRRMTG